MENVVAKQTFVCLVFVCIGDNLVCRYENGFQFISLPVCYHSPCTVCVCQMMEIRYCAQEIHFVNFSALSFFIPFI